MAESLCTKITSWPSVRTETKTGREGWECNSYLDLCIFSTVCFSHVGTDDYRMSQNLIIRQYESSTDGV